MTADGACHTRKCHDAIAARNTHAVIPPRKTGSKRQRPGVAPLRGQPIVMTMKTIARISALLLLAILTLPFAYYAINFAQGGFRGALPDPHYILSDNMAANISIFVHMATGAVITVLVPLQLISALRRRLPGLHRWSGRLIILAALATALGGLIYIPLRGTIGGPLMDVGFSIYGALMLLAAAQTILHARARRIVTHNEWALRFFWLALGSWLYRVHYGLWYLVTNGLWSNPEFTGGFDHVQNFAFYLPYLIGVEIYLRRKRQGRRRATKRLPDTQSLSNS